VTKPWEGTGLSDFRTWLGETRKREGLVYRGDGDFLQVGPYERGVRLVTLLEFKNGTEWASRGQLTMLDYLARQPGWECRVVADRVPDPSNADPHREVHVRDPRRGTSGVMRLDKLAAWVDSRAYRPSVDGEARAPEV
jgi:hypothetical protein